MAWEQPHLHATQVFSGPPCNEFDPSATISSSRPPHGNYGEDRMSEEALALVITIATFGLFFAWVPFLHLVCPPCSRLLDRRRLQKELAKEPHPRSSVHLDPSRQKLYEFLNNSRTLSS